MCPTNRLGTVDLFFVSHHGQPVSNAPFLVHPLRARVALMNNGTRKGGQPDAMRVLYSAPGLEDLWQIHFSLLSGQEYTTPGMFIANAVDDQPSEIPIAAMTPPPAGAEMLFDGSREMLDEKWTYWEGPRFNSSLPIKWPIVEDPPGRPATSAGLPVRTGQDALGGDGRRERCGQGG